MGLKPIFFTFFAKTDEWRQALRRLPNSLKARLPGSDLSSWITKSSRTASCVSRLTARKREAVSDQITHLFTVEGVDYERLEVSSPGVDRPLKRARDWQRFLGRPVHVELYEPLKAEGFPEAGRRKLEGRALEVVGEGPEAAVRFSFEELHIARTPAEAVKGKKVGKKAPAAAPVVVTFDLADVDRANLIAELDFRGKK